jgi:hypothetical protein
MVLASEVPQRLSFVTLGTRHMRGRRDFYAAWGWQERDGGSDEFAQFAMGGVRLALYPLDLLGAEAAPGLPAPAAGWNGVTLAINVGSREQVDAAYRVALAAGARSTAEPVAVSGAAAPRTSPTPRASGGRSPGSLTSTRRRSSRLPLAYWSSRRPTTSWSQKTCE